MSCKMSKNTAKLVFLAGVLSLFKFLPQLKLLIHKLLWTVFLYKKLPDTKSNHVYGSVKTYTRKNCLFNESRSCTANLRIGKF